MHLLRYHIACLFFSIATLWFCSDYNVWASSSPYHTLANFVYQLMDHIDWKHTSRVTLCTYGYDRIAEHLTRQNSLTLIKVKRLDVRSIEQLDAISSCNAVYIAQSEERDIAKIVEIASKHQTITIANMQRFTYDYMGTVEFDLVRGQITMKINAYALNAADLTISPLLSKFIVEYP